MNIKKLALATCALALASWATPRMIAQAAAPPTHQDPGQQGEYNGDHQDTGAAALDTAGVVEAPEGKEMPEGKATPETREPASVAEPVNSSPDTDRIQDSHSDSIPD